MQNRIDRLENLVLSLMTNGSQAAGPAAAAAALSGHDSVESGQNYQDLELDDDVDGQNEESDTEAVTKSFGIMKVDNNKSMYISEAHWASVLNDVSGVVRLISFRFLTGTDCGGSPILPKLQKTVRRASAENTGHETRSRYYHHVTFWLSKGTQQIRNFGLVSFTIYHRYADSAILQ